MTRREKASEALRKGLKLQDRGKRREALEYFQKAATLLPTWSTPLYNIGLCFKYARKWEEALDYNQRATALDRKNQAAWWNLGIAATALGRWDVARKAWRGFGISLSDGEGPVDLPCGFSPIRLDPNGNPEVVWANRIDPARAEIVSIPFPESKHRWRDVVLNDGAPVGHRQYQGKEVPVFNELELLEASDFGTYVARVKMPDRPEDSEKLVETADALEVCAEDWSTSVRFLCKACSEGRPHKTHDTKAAPPDGVHIIGIAARDRDQAQKVLSTWQAGLEGIEIESLDDALEPGWGRTKS